MKQSDKDISHGGFHVSNFRELRRYSLQYTVVQIAARPINMEDDERAGNLLTERFLTYAVEKFCLFRVVEEFECP